MQPDAASVKAVTSWLSSNGIRAKVSKGHGDWVHFSTTVGKANTLFNADFSDYHHPASGKKAVRSMAYSLPAHMMAHVAVVHPVVGCGSRKKRSLARC
jgi:tripeptidyl-peptidase-1